MKKLLVGLLLLAMAVAMVVFAVAQTTPETSEKETPDAETSAVNSAGEPSSGVYTVVVENGRFMPADLEVNVGDTVEWVNLDDVDHTVTFESCAIDRELPAGSTVRYTFTRAGGVSYYGSLLHPKAQGSVTVN